MYLVIFIINFINIIITRPCYLGSETWSSQKSKSKYRSHLVGDKLHLSTRQASKNMGAKEICIQRGAILGRGRILLARLFVVFTPAKTWNLPFNKKLLLCSCIFSGSVNENGRRGMWTRPTLPWVVFLWVFQYVQTGFCFELYGVLQTVYNGLLANTWLNTQLLLGF